jgi:hypothetical protein
MTHAVGRINIIIINIITDLEEAEYEGGLNSTGSG